MKRKSALDPRVSGFNDLLKDLEEDKFEQPSPLPATNALEKHKNSGKELEIDMIKEKSKNRRVSQAQQKSMTVELDAPEGLGKNKIINRQMT